MRILVVLVSKAGAYSPEEVEARRQALMVHASPGTEIDIGFPEEGSVFGTFGPTEYDITMVAPHVMRRIQRAQEEGYDGVYMNGMYDPGVEAARHLVDIPVLGPGRVVSHVACMLANKIGGIAANDEGIPFLERMIASYGLTDRYTRIRGVNIPLTEIRHRKEEARRRFIELSRLAMADGADIIVSLCHVIVPTHIPAKEVERELGVPVIDGMALGVKMTEMLASLGLSHSRKAYPRPA